MHYAASVELANLLELLAELIIVYSIRVEQSSIAL